MEVSHLDPSKFYLVSGKTLADFQNRLDRVWGGDNIQRGPGIFRRGSGSAGFSLAARGGGGGGSPPGSSLIPALTVYDASAGATAYIGVTPGVVTDLTNSGTVWIPTLNGNPINVQIGSPLAWPKSAAVNSGATVAYLNATVATATGFITALEIDTDTGSGVPSSTDANWYYLLSTIAVSVVSMIAKVTCNNENPYSKNYAICGILPLTDGTAYRVGT